MNKNLPIIGMLLVVLVFSAGASIVLTEDEYAGIPGETISGQFNFANNYGKNLTDVTIELEIADLNEENVVFTPSNTFGYIADGVGLNIDFSFDIPTSASYGLKEGVFYVYEDNTTLLDSVEFDLNVLEEYSMTITGTNTHEVFPEDAETFTVTVENTGAEDLTGVTWSYNTENFVDEDGNEMVISFSEDNFNLVSGATKDVVITITPHEDQYFYPEKDLDYSGALTLSNTEASTTFNLEIEMDNKAFGHINFEDLDDLDELEPGEDFKIEIETENAKFDITDIQVEVTILDFDEGDNVEEESDDYDLDDGDDENTEFEFEVPLNVDDKKYDVLVKVTGDSDEDDHDDFTYYLFYNDAIDVEKDEKYDAAFSYITLEPSTPQCGSLLTIKTEVVNVGTKKLDDMYVKVEIKELNLEQKSEEFDLKHDDEDDRSDKVDFTLTLPSDMEKKTYTLEVLAYDEDNDLIGGLVETFTPNGDCIVSEDFESEDDSEENSGSNSNDGEVDEDGTLFLPTGWTTFELFENDSAKTVFWIIGDLALIVIIIYFLTLFFKKRK